MIATYITAYAIVLVFLSTHPTLGCVMGIMLGRSAV